MFAVCTLVIGLVSAGSGARAVLDTLTTEGIGCTFLPPDQVAVHEQEVQQQYALAQARQVTVPVHIKESAFPAVPESMRNAYERGVWRITVEVLIDPRGIVLKADVISSDHCWLESECLRAAWLTRFEPPMEGGKPVWAVAEIPYKIVLNN